MQELQREINMDAKEALVVFEGTKIRRTWHDDQWFFSVVDIVGVLTDSSIPRRYWSDLKIKLEEEGFELYDRIVQLKLPAADGKKYETDCANTESMFRIIQSIPSPKAEPFKRWLAKIGYERVQEIEDPELAHEWLEVIGKESNYTVEVTSKKIVDHLGNSNESYREHYSYFNRHYSSLPKGSGGFIDPKENTYPKRW